MRKLITENIPTFKISYVFFDASHETEISMLINGKNVLSFERDGKALTTRWDIDELVLWLRNFIDNMKEDPFPVEIKGEYAAIKDIYAREFDTNDEDELDAYFDRLDEWNCQHRWHFASSGAILSDLYFELKKDNVEISWNNLDAEEGVTFEFKIGGEQIPKDQFVNEVNSFINEYANHWFLP